MDSFEAKTAENLWEKLDPARLAAPIAFFTTGLVLLVVSGRVRREELIDLVTGENQALVLVSVAALLICSESLVNSLVGYVLRFLEGYGCWPSFIRARLIKRKLSSFKEKRSELTELLGRHPGLKSATLEVAKRIASLQDQVSMMPIDSRVMPTQFGNVLRAAEDHPFDRYGISGVRAWPLLWMCLPRHVRVAVNSARRDLERAVSLMIWSGLLSLWIVFIPWGRWVVVAGVLSGVGVVVCYLALEAPAQRFALIFQSTYDLYRFDLYEQLRLRPPASPFEEWEAAQDWGSSINEVLFSQMPDRGGAFEHKPAPSVGNVD